MASDALRSLGQQIHDGRIRKGLSQATLGARVGKSRVSISNIERGKHKPRSELLGRLFAVLELKELHIGWHRITPAYLPAVTAERVETLEKQLVLPFGRKQVFKASSLTLEPRDGRLIISAEFEGLSETGTGSKTG